LKLPAPATWAEAQEACARAQRPWFSWSDHFLAPLALVAGLDLTTAVFPWRKLGVTDWSGWVAEHQVQAGYNGRYFMVLPVGGPAFAGWPTQRSGAAWCGYRASS